MGIIKVLTNKAKMWIGMTFEEIRCEIPEPICGRWNDGGKVITFTVLGAAAILYFKGEICNKVEIFQLRETVFDE